MITTPKWLGLLAAAFVAGSFIASPELRAYAANTVFSSDIVDGQVMTVDLANNAVTSAKINDGGVKTADIGDAEVKAVDIGGGAVTNAKLANGAVNSPKIADNSITAADIGADAVGASEIAANAVGASEIAGVSELRFASCTKTNNNPGGPGSGHFVQCDVSGADPDDNVIVTKNGGSPCWVTSLAGISQSGKVDITAINACTVAIAPGTITFSIFVYDPEIIIIPPP